MGRDGLQEVKHVQAQQHQDVQLARLNRFDVHVEPPPQVLPGADMRRHQVVEAPGSRDGFARLPCGLCDGVVSGGVERHNLLNAQRLALCNVGSYLLGDVSRLFERPPLDLDPLTFQDHFGSSRLCHVNVRLARTHHKTERVVGGGF